MREPYSPDSNWVKASGSYGDPRYSPNEKGKLMHDVWRIPSINNMAKERTGYPTQKPLALLDRIIKASSNKGDVVVDPFCGCATTCVAADRLQRDWIGIDISEKAAELVVERIKADQGLFQEIIARTDIPKRTDLGNIPDTTLVKTKHYYMESKVEIVMGVVCIFKAKFRS